jgi:hypothetical protein
MVVFMILNNEKVHISQIYNNSQNFIARFISNFSPHCNFQKLSESLYSRKTITVIPVAGEKSPQIRALHGSPMGDPFKNGRPMGTHGYPLGKLQISLLKQNTQ